MYNVHVHVTNQGHGGKHPQSPALLVLCYGFNFYYSILEEDLFCTVLI